jgi:large subunit ribosomal protein L25
LAAIELQVAPRQVQGKKVRFLRREGIIPGNVYGRSVPSTAVQFGEREFERHAGRAGGSTLVTLTGLDGTPRTVLLKRVERVPTTGRLQHIDFYQVEEREKLQVDVSLQFVGTSEAVERRDGTLLQALSHIRIESYPRDLPSAIEVDLEVLTDFDATIHVRDLKVPAEVTVLSDPDEMVAKVLPPRVREEEAEETVAEAAAVGEPVEAAGEPAAREESETES